MNENSFIENNEIFALGDFSITSNLDSSSDATKVYQYGDIYTLGALSQSIDDIPTNILVNSQNLEKLDLSNPKLFLKYSSFVEKVKNSLENIITSYPSSLRISSLVVGYSYGDTNVINISYDNKNDTTSFYLLTNYLDNPGKLAYVTVDNINEYKDLTQNYLKYYFEYENNLYEIIDFIPANLIKNDKLFIKVSGKPFEITDSVKRIVGYITPSTDFKNEYLSQLDFFERYILNDSFRVTDTLEDNGGREYEYKLKFSIPKKDKYNYDFETNQYEKFLTDLLKVATKYDETYLNVTARKLIPKSFQDISINSNKFPTYGKANVLLNTMSHFFDQIYGNINALKYYDQIESYNQSFEDRKSLLRIAKNKGFEIFGENTDNIIPKSDLKPFIKNIDYLLNSKGTRQSILTALNYLNIPDELIEFNEKVYTTTAVNYDGLNYFYETIDDGLTLANVPINEDGSPNLSKNTNIFHSDSYFNSLSNLLPEIETNFFQKSNINQYSEILANIGFNLTGDGLSFGLYNIDWSNLACFSYTGGTIVNPLPETFFDNCNCIIPLDDLSLQICTTPLNPYDTYCPPLVVDVVPNCVAIPQTGITLSGDTACEFTLSLTSNEGIENVVTPSEIIPVNYISIPYTMNLTSCIETIENSLEKQVISKHYYTNDSISAMAAGGYVSIIRLYDTITDSAENIDLNPSTTPYLTGCAGSLSADDLLFPTGTTESELSTWANNLQILIENAICVIYSGLPVAPTNNGTYFLNVEAYADGTFNIIFNNKNNPVSPEYNIGINKNDANFTFYDGSMSHNSNSYYLSFEDLEINYTGDTICGPLYVNKTIPEADLLSILDINYDEITFTTSELDIILDDNSSFTSRICLIDGNLTGDTYTYGAYLDINVYGGIPPYSFTGITQGQFFNSGETYSFFVGDTGCNIVQITGEVICNEDLCLGNQISTTQTTVIETKQMEVEVECPAINITHTMYLAGNGSMIGQVTTYDYVLEFNNFEVLDDPTYEIDIISQDNIFNFTGNTSTFNQSVAFTIDSLNVSLAVYIRLTDGECIYEQEIEIFSLEYGLVEEDSSDDILLAPSYTIIEEVDMEVTKTVYEVTPNTPVINASYLCNDNGTATLTVNVSGGTLPYIYYGGSDGQIVEADTGVPISIYVEDANGCISNVVELLIDCGNEVIECNAINLEASLETTSLDNINETATLTFTYNITGLAFDDSVEEVNLVVSGIGTTNNYILGSPVMKTFSGDFGAEQIYLDFTPNILTSGTYKFIIVIKTENCTYTDIFEMSVDASILSDVDNYINILE